MDSQFFLFVLREMFYNLFNEQLGDKLKFVLSPDVILCGWLGSKHQLTNYLTNCLFLPFRSIPLHFFQKPLPISPVFAVANAWFLCRPAE